MTNSDTSDCTSIERPLREHFARLAIAFRVFRHPPLHTVKESQELRGNIPGSHIKNLLLRDKKRRIWLVTVREDHPVDLKGLRPVLGASGTLSFAGPDLLAETLAVEQGAVTPLAVMNDSAGRVTAVLDEALLAATWINCHPLHNEATVSLTPAELLGFMRDRGHDPTIHRFPDLQADMTGTPDTPSAA
ncbi:MAG: prolyl-tRNA synthetase associated domain-containing protein [Candidatus Schekmanbacteria bacterium]|nr:prolyl-tRNA synthetase associated domain-containing protein [Candidatus Schekmanbacteria bacterium]